MWVGAAGVVGVRRSVCVNVWCSGGVDWGGGGGGGPNCGGLEAYAIRQAWRERGESTFLKETASITLPMLSG